MLCGGNWNFKARLCELSSHNPLNSCVGPTSGSPRCKLRSAPLPRTTQRPNRCSSLNTAQGLNLGSEQSLSTSLLSIKLTQKSSELRTAQLSDSIQCPTCDKGGLKWSDSSCPDMIPSTMCCSCISGLNVASKRLACLGTMIRTQVMRRSIQLWRSDSTNKLTRRQTQVDLILMLSLQWSAISLSWPLGKGDKSPLPLFYKSLESQVKRASSYI